MAKKQEWTATGRRKRSVARVRLTGGTGNITVNGVAVEDYMPYATLVMDLKQPLVATGNENRFDIDVKEIEEVIKNTNEEKEAKINWTNAWSKKYPVLATYQNKVDISKYAFEIRSMLNSLSKEYGFNDLDSMLVLKDILYHEWKDNK